MFNLFYKLNLLPRHVPGTSFKSDTACRQPLQAPSAIRNQLSPGAAEPVAVVSSNFETNSSRSKL